MRYSRGRAGGVELHIIAADLNDSRVVVSPALAVNGLGTAEPFSGFVRRLRPIAAINGTFFSKQSLRPVGDILINGKLVYFGGMGTALAFAADGVDCIRLPKSRRVDWSGYRSAVAAGPLLVWGGFAKPAPGGEGFGDPRVFSRSAPRSALGITKDNRLLLVTTVRGVSLARLAKAMRQLGALYAINLDGGSSVGMWYRGRTIRSPRGRLTNVLCVFLKTQRSSQHELRPPRGLDWRAGHRKQPPPPTMVFQAAGVGVSVELPRTWGQQQFIRVRADGPLPEGCAIRVQVDGRSVAVVGRLPAEVEVTINGTARPKHKLWVGLLDEAGKTLGSAYRIFRLDDSAVP